MICWIINSHVCTLRVSSCWKRRKRKRTYSSLFSLLSSAQNIFFLWLTFCCEDHCGSEVKPGKPVTWQIHTLWNMFTVQLVGSLNCFWPFEKGYVRFHLGEGQKRSLKDGQRETFKGYNLQHRSYLLFTQWATFGGSGEKKLQEKGIQVRHLWCHGL